MASTHLCIIPAQALSIRLPGKVLKLVGRETMLEHVIGTVAAAKVFGSIVVATGDDEIAAALVARGVRVVLSDRRYSSGLRRACGAALALFRDGERFASVTCLSASLVGLSGAILQRYVTSLEQQCAMSDVDDVPRMLAWTSPMNSMDEFVATKVIKVVKTDSERILFCSRAPIPFSCEGYDFDPPSPAGGAFQCGAERLFPCYGLTSGSLGVIDRQPLLRCEELEQVDLLAALSSSGMVVSAFVVDAEEREGLIDVVDSEDLALARTVLAPLKVPQ